MLDLHDRGQFLNFTAVLEGALIGLAFVLGWVADINPLDNLYWSWKSAAWGIAGAVPLAIFFFILDRLPIEALQRVTRLLIEVMGPPLAACRWFDLILLALFIGFAEELLFRGVVQPWLEGGGWILALVISNIIFGMLHAVTKTYAVLACLIGIYLGLMFDAGGSRNLLAPMLTHGVYDYIGFLIVIAEYRKHHRAIVYTVEPPDDEADVEP